MSRITIRPKAREDFFDIWFWSADEWGAAKADEYLEGFEFAKQTLVDYPEIGAACDEIRKGLRRYIVAHHRIYYVIKGDSIDIVRVLHERMDAVEHFEDD